MTNRRRFLTTSATALGSFAVGTCFDNRLRCVAAGEGERKPMRLVPVADEVTGLPLLKLPDGFRYRSFGWLGDPMSDGARTPAAHDGMGVIAQDGERVTLCRNHEVGGGSTAIEVPGSYDPKARGGCTNLTFDLKSGEWLSARWSLRGTVRNCAGGPTPWNTWLSCEEFIAVPGEFKKNDEEEYARTHGWIFEVPVEGAERPEPLTDMGCFWHEAVAVDPATGFVYETEDRGISGFYRFRPKQREKLAEGGTLEMMRIPGHPDLRRKTDPEATYPVEWVPIEDPTRGHTPESVNAGKPDTLGVFAQGKAHAGTTFARLEGCWHGEGTIFFVATSGGRAGAGQVWAYRPREETLRLVFESPDKKTLYKPDNLTVSPRGGLVLCEDSDRVPQHLYSLSQSGELMPFAENAIDFSQMDRNRLGPDHRRKLRRDYRDGEWAGATFDASGKWLFANIQSPGLTVAITGPWETLGL